ncbi:MAG: DUF3090 domain-containing protein [Acidimicrobiia bacterium]|nr:DUF3090 domain-containing protein [Acidimicrobiia bacterium]
MTTFYEFDEVDAFTVGTVGQPGSRTFYVQVRADGRSVTVKCEKQQATAISEHVQKVLSDLPPPEDRPMPGALELNEPVEASFTLGPIGLGYDPGADRVLIQLEEVGEYDDDGDEVETDDRGHVRLLVSRGQAAAFCDRADAIVGAGRPPCQWCGNPIDPDGHPCPRMN